MKRIILFSFFCFAAISGRGQVTSLSQNFDGVCASGSGTPASWLVYNPIVSTYSYGAWHCTATNGRGGTPGMQCADTFAGTFHADTSYLLTPHLNLSSYTGNVFLQFDSKTSNIHLGGELAVEYTTSTTNPDTSGTINLTPSLMPVIGIGDSTSWVKHVVDLTPYKMSGPFYIAFRYISTATTGIAWYLDNVFTETYNITLGVPATNSNGLNLSISGLCNNNEINFVYATAIPGAYRLSLTDMMGREVYKQQLNVTGNGTNYRISGLNMAAGVYVLKMGNESIVGFTKVIIQ